MKKLNSYDEGERRIRTGITNTNERGKLDEKENGDQGCEQQRMGPRPKTLNWSRQTKTEIGGEEESQSERQQGDDD